SKESREYGAKKEVSGLSSAMAILAGKSLAAILVGNFFIRFNKPVTPTKIFKREEKALEWLATFD
ncbi:MAG: STAS/SEC14 domain-containing protein, partial [Flavobacteriales bacterium]|nr:STAS/SEC14 domain-containing protein [Flavobacteriales bacterium]